MINRLHNAKSWILSETYTNHDSRTEHCRAARARTLWIVKNKIPQQHSQLSGAHLYNLIIFILGTYTHHNIYVRAPQLSVSVCAVHFAFAVCCFVVPSHGHGIRTACRIAPSGTGVTALDLREHCRLWFFLGSMLQLLLLFYLIIFIMVLNSTDRPYTTWRIYNSNHARRAYRVRLKHKRKCCCVTHKFWYILQWVGELEGLDPIFLSYWFLNLHYLNKCWWIYKYNSNKTTRNRQWQSLFNKAWF